MLEKRCDSKEGEVPLRVRDEPLARPKARSEEGMAIIMKVPDKDNK